MDDSDISEAGRQARFARWETLGLDQVKADLATGGHRVVGGPPQVRQLAWEWVRQKEAANQLKVKPVKRDDDLIVELLERLESLALPVGALVVLDGQTEELAIEDHTPDEVEYHLGLIREAGLVDSPGSQPAAGGITFRGLNNRGHDLLSQRVKADSSVSQRGPSTGIIRQIDNAVSDLRRSDYNTFNRHIRRLARLLHSEQLEIITAQLTAGIDVDAWLEIARQEDEHGFANAELEWPPDHEKELGTCILLIDKFAASPNQAMAISHEFYRIDDSSITAMLRHLVEQMIVPFARDYIDYIMPRITSPLETPPMKQEGPKSKKVFVVHGRDDDSKTKVELFLRAIGLDPIILHQRPNRGRHILTKFQEESEGASFAVVIMAPDDEGGLIGEASNKRARQNVVFELGFFIGVLGSENVAALIGSAVEKPSDFAGIGYIDLDTAGAWKTFLAREMAAAEIPFDPHAVFRA